MGVRRSVPVLVDGAVHTLELLALWKVTALDRAAVHRIPKAVSIFESSPSRYLLQAATCAFSGAGPVGLRDEGAPRAFTLERTPA